MRSMSRFLLGAALALGFSSAALAETPATESGEFTLTAELRLDQQFELTLADPAARLLHGPNGPSTMSCSHVVNTSEYETCVVTTEGTPRPAMPAAIAAN